jgi:hypothetical protein
MNFDILYQEKDWDIKPIAPVRFAVHSDGQAQERCVALSAGATYLVLYDLVDRL